MQRKEKLKRVFQSKCTQRERRKNSRYSRLCRQFWCCKKRLVIDFVSQNDNITSIIGTMAILYFWSKSSKAWLISLHTFSPNNHLLISPLIYWDLLNIPKRKLIPFHYCLSKLPFYLWKWPSFVYRPLLFPLGLSFNVKNPKHVNLALAFSCDINTNLYYIIPLKMIPLSRTIYNIIPHCCIYPALVK